MTTYKQKYTSLDHIKSVSIIIDNQMIEFKSDFINETPMFFNPIKFLWIPEHTMIGLMEGYESLGYIVIPELKDYHVENKYEETLNIFVDYDMTLQELIDNSRFIVVTDKSDLIGEFSLDAGEDGMYYWSYDSKIYSKYNCEYEDVERMLTSFGEAGYFIAWYDHDMNLI